MKKLILLILLLVAAVAIGLTVRAYPGVMILQTTQWRIDIPLWFAVTIFVLAGVVFYFTFKVIAGILAAPAKVMAMKSEWDRQHARKDFYQGVLALIEGNWHKSGKLLSHNLALSESPLVNYLGLAKVAQEQGRDSERDRYLKLAYEQDKSAHIAVGLTQAHCQFQHGQYEQSLATLEHLHTQEPKHPRVLASLKRLYCQLNDWEKLHLLLPQLRKVHAIDEAEHTRLEREVFIHRLAAAEKEPTPDAIKKVWQRLPKRYHTDPVMVYQYVNALISLRDPFTAEDCIRLALKRDWQERLVRLYGLIEHPEPEKLLTQAQNWLKQHGESASLLLTLGRLSSACQLWGQAERFFEASLNINPDVETYTELACLFERLDQRELSHQYFRKGATLISNPLLERLPVGHIPQERT